MQICEIKNWRKIKDRTHLLSLLYCIDLKQNKCTKVRIAHFESFVAQTINVSDNTGSVGGAPAFRDIYFF